MDPTGHKRVEGDSVGDYSYRKSQKEKKKEQNPPRPKYPNPMKIIKDIVSGVADNIKDIANSIKDDVEELKKESKKAKLKSYVKPLNFLLGAQKYGQDKIVESNGNRDVYISAFNVDKAIDYNLSEGDRLSATSIGLGAAGIAASAIPFPPTQIILGGGFSISSIIIGVQSGDAYKLATNISKAQKEYGSDMGIIIHFDASGTTEIRPQNYIWNKIND